jgi:cellulose synthase (UDP-forming)
MIFQYGITWVSLGILLVILARFRDRERLRWVAVGIGFLLTARYLYWRVAYTLNTSDLPSLIISGTILAAEIYGFGATLLFYFQVATPTVRSSVLPEHQDLPMVDVFVTSYDESVEIVRRTLMGCLAIEYPQDKKKVYLLDDGSREEMKKLAQSLGCSYLTRSSREHAKAGNLNNALKFSIGEFIVNFDADHIPVRSFLKKTIGYFSDPKVALVQTPHYFYNPDIYQRNLRLGKKIAHEQDLFFHVIQSGRDFTNSSFYCGSGAVIRREALNKIQGFAVRSVTEDIHTTMLIHALGYRTVYVREILAVGLSPESFKSYLCQRQRWTRGHLQIFLSRDNPFLLKGLTLAQRINYFASIYYFMFGPSRIVYLAVPLAYLLLGIPPLIAPLSDIVNIYGSHYLGSLIPFFMISGRYRNPFWSDVYETTMCFSLTATVIGTLLKPRELLFNVTPKGQKFSKSIMDVASTTPHITLMILLTLGLILGGYSLFRWEENPDALLVSLVLGSYNLVLLICAIFGSRESIQIRDSFRLERHIPCELVFDQQSFVTQTANISNSGLGIYLDSPVYFPQRVNVRLNHGGEKLEIPGKIVCNDLGPAGKYLVGIRFDAPSAEQERKLIKIIYSVQEDWKVDEDVEESFVKSFTQLLVSPVNTFLKLKKIIRTQPRLEVVLPCAIEVNGQEMMVYTKEISSRGARLMAPKGSLPVHTHLRLQISYPDRPLVLGEAEVVWSKSLFNKDLIGVRWAEDHPSLYETLKSMNMKKGNSETTGEKLHHGH